MSGFWNIRILRGTRALQMAQSSKSVAPELKPQVECYCATAFYQIAISYNFPKYSAFRVWINLCELVLGSAKSSSNTAEAISGKNSKDENVVFVAGATGRVGSRTVRYAFYYAFQF